MAAAFLSFGLTRNINHALHRHIFQNFDWDTNEQAVGRPSFTGRVDS